MRALTHQQQPTPARLTALVDELARVSQWFGREEPRRYELQQSIQRLLETSDHAQLARAVLRCAVTVDRMYSSALKRLVKARLTELSRLLTAERAGA